MQLHQLDIRQLRQINGLRLGHAIRDLINPPVFAVDILVIMALAGVGPVGDVHAAVRAVVEGEAAEPWVVGDQDIGAVIGDVAGALAFEDVVVDAVAVDVAMKRLLRYSSGQLSPR